MLVQESDPGPRQRSARSRWRVTALASVAALTIGGLTLAGSASAATMATIHAAPTGSGTACTQAAPCSIQQAQTTARGLTATMTGDIAIVLAGGTYSLSAPISLSPQDSGNNGHKVIWQAAAGARPVLSGGVPITSWTETSAGSKMWTAPAPAGLRTRQLYANDTRIPRASGQLGVGPLAGVSLTQNTTGGFTANNSTMSTWRNPSSIEFLFAKGNGAWTEPRCPVSTISGTAITMRQPCWNNLFLPTTPRAHDGDKPHGGFPGLAGTAVPSTIENAYELLAPGRWYLDETQQKFYYNAQSTDNVPAMSFVAPRLERLMTSTGTPSAPVHDVTFQGIEFAYATWLQPSGNDGFAEMQANMTITGVNGNTTQGLCTYYSGGVCPFAAWTRQPAAVDMVGTRNVSFLGNKFHHLGGAGLGMYHGVNSNLVQGNEVTDVSGNGIVLGAIDDQQPLDNLTLGKTATQSSIAWGGAASRAVDGNTDGDFYDNSVSHTASQANAWWQVDLGSVQSMTSLSVFNRTDCCADRLTDYWVFVSASPFNTSLTPTQQAAQPGVWSTHRTTQALTPSTIPANTSGRYIMVQLAGTGYLALAEVKASAEVASKNTISNNYVHGNGVEFTGAVGIFTGYSQYTTITHNQISEQPYSGISLGWGGWHSNAVTPYTNPNVNSDNVITNNLISNVMRVRGDGGAIYTNGPQGFVPGHGVTIRGNVALTSKNSNHEYYNDEGTSHSVIDRNIQYNDNAYFNGGCSTMGPVTVTNSFHTGGLNRHICANLPPASAFVDGGGNTLIPKNPLPSQLDQAILRGAGLEAAYTGLTTKDKPVVGLVSPPDNGTVMISGWGFTTNPTVTIGGNTSPNVTYLSSTHLIATVPAGTSGGLLTVTTPAGTSQPVPTLLAPNLATGKPATQSSTLTVGAASRAVDGNPDGVYANGSVTHTDSNANAWWQVDLGAAQQVTSMSLYGRTDCCASRLSDYWVFVSSTPFNTALTPAQQAAQPGVWSNHQTAQPNNPTTLPVNTSGRYVMVQLAGTGYLSLAEVVVA